MFYFYHHHIMGFIVFARVENSQKLKEVANFIQEGDAEEYCQLKNIKAAVAKDKAK